MNTYSYEVIYSKMKQGIWSIMLIHLEIALPQLSSYLVIY